MIEETHGRLKAKCRQSYEIALARHRASGRNHPDWMAPKAFVPVHMGSSEEHEIGMRAGVEFQVFKPVTDQEREMVLNICKMVSYLR